MCPSHPDGGSRCAQRDPNLVAREFQSFLEFHRDSPRGHGFIALLGWLPSWALPGPSPAPRRVESPCWAFARGGVPGPAGSSTSTLLPRPLVGSGSGFGLWLGWARLGFFLWLITASNGLGLTLTQLPMSREVLGRSRKS